MSKSFDTFKDNIARAVRRPESEIKLTTTLASLDLATNTPQFANLIIEIGHELGVEIGPDQFLPIKTLNQLAEVMDAAVAAKGA